MNDSTSYVQRFLLDELDIRGCRPARPGISACLSPLTPQYRAGSGEKASVTRGSHAESARTAILGYSRQSVMQRVTFSTISAAQSPWFPASGTRISSATT